MKKFDVVAASFFDDDFQEFGANSPFAAVDGFGVQERNIVPPQMGLPSFTESLNIIQSPFCFRNVSACGPCGTKTVIANPDHEPAQIVGAFLWYR